MSEEKKGIWTSLPIPLKIASVGAIAIGLYFIGKQVYKQFKKPPKFDLPQGGGGIPVVSYDPKGNPVQWKPQPLSAELYDVMNGLFTMSGTKDAAFTKLGQLATNDMLTAVYNEFNKTYGGGDSLTTWINDEYWTDFLGDGKALALARLSAAGLP